MIRTFVFASVVLLLLATLSHARDITLEWDPNTEPDITGYKIYYKAGSPDLPLDGTGAAEGPSPVDIGNNTRATLRGLDGSKIYYFAVTAYNSAGYESSFSNLVASDWVPVQTFPENGATTSASVQFMWTPPPSDLNVSYTLYYGTDPSFSSIPPLPPEYGPPSAVPAPHYLGPLLGVLLAGLLASTRRRPLARATAASFFCVFLLSSCGGGGGTAGGTPGVLSGAIPGGDTGGDSEGSVGGAAESTAPFTRAIQAGTSTNQSITGLKEGMTYYWKVVANDGEKIRESTTFTFTVQ